MTDEETGRDDESPATSPDENTDSLPTMSVDDAKHLTDEIKTALDGVWDLVARAYVEGAWLAMGYGSWDDYVKSEFEGHKIRVPREERDAVVCSRCPKGPSLTAPSGHSTETRHTR